MSPRHLPPRAKQRNSKRPALTRSTSTAAGTESLPRSPNEHDTSVDSQTVASHESRAAMKQAHADLERGLEDTDCRGNAREIIKRAARRSK